MRNAFLDDLTSDVSYAIRGLARSPGFTAAAVITLALGIGAATAVFSVVNTVLLRPLPYNNSDRLVRIVQRAAPANPSAPLLRRNDMSQAELSQWRKSTRTLSAMAITIAPPITLMPTASGSARLTGSLMSTNTFAMLGARAQLGRTFEPADAAAGSNVVVISARGQAVQGATTDLAQGTTVMIAGQRGSDGTFNANEILVLPSGSNLAPSGN